MIKKSFIFLSISAAFFVQAQDITTIRNTADIYSSNNFIGTAKSQAMAGSLGALGGDVSVLNSNPAGLGVFITGNVQGTLGIQNSKNEVSLSGNSINYTINKTDFNQAGGVAVFEPLTNESKWKFVNVGVNYSHSSTEDYIQSPGNSNIVIQKNLLDSSNNPVVGNLSYQGHAYNRYGSNSKTSIGIGANYNNNLYIGAGLNFHNADIEQYDSAKLNLDLDNTTSVYDKQYTPYSESSNGFSATFGVISKISKEFRVGAAIETPTWWTINRAFTEYSPDSSGFIGYDTYAEDRTLASPLKATVSAAFVPNKNFAINVDYTMGVTKPKYKVQGDAETELNSFFKSEYKNLSEVKIGAEYRIKQLRLRGGYGFASSPFDATTVNAFSSSGTVGNTSYDNFILGKRNTLGAGLGYDFNSMFIDVAYQNVTSEYSNPFLFGSSAFGSGYYSTDFDVNSSTYVVSNVKNTRNNIFVTLGWKF